MADRLRPMAKKLIQEYIEANLGSDRLEARYVREIVHQSYSHFARCFLGTFGMRFTEYRRERRIERVKTLMLTTNMPLCQIAVEVGMADQPHLSKAFKRVVGCTPREWRERMSEALR